MSHLQGLYYEVSSINNKIIIELGIKDLEGFLEVEGSDS